MQQTTKVELSIGLETKDKNLEIHPEEVIEFIDDRMDAGRFHETKGLWQGELENSLVFMVIDPDIEEMKTLKQDLEEEFKQESVMMTRESVEVEF